MHTTFKKTRIGPSGRITGSTFHCYLIAPGVKCKPLPWSKKSHIIRSLSFSELIYHLLTALATLPSLWDIPRSFRSNSFLSWGLCPCFSLGLDLFTPGYSHNHVRSEIISIITSSLQPSTVASLPTCLLFTSRMHIVNEQVFEIAREVIIEVKLL